MVIKIGLLDIIIGVTTYSVLAQDRIDGPSHEIDIDQFVTVGKLSKNMTTVIYVVGFDSFFLVINAKCTICISIISNNIIAPNIP